MSEQAEQIADRLVEVFTPALGDDAAVEAVALIRGLIDPPDVSPISTNYFLVDPDAALAYVVTMSGRVDVASWAEAVIESDDVVAVMGDEVLVYGDEVTVGFADGTVATLTPNTGETVVFPLVESFDNAAVDGTTVRGGDLGDWLVDGTPDVLTVSGGNVDIGGVATLVSPDIPIPADAGVTKIDVRTRRLGTWEAADEFTIGVFADGTRLGSEGSYDLSGYSVLQIQVGVSCNVSGGDGSGTAERLRVYDVTIGGD